MSAPDRVTLRFWCRDIIDVGTEEFPLDEDQSGPPDADYEYIRKAALPVEEIRDRIIALEQNIAALDTLNNPQLNGVLGCLEASLQTYRRILAVLEGNDE